MECFCHFLFFFSCHSGVISRKNSAFFCFLHITISIQIIHLYLHTDVEVLHTYLTMLEKRDYIFFTSLILNKYYITVNTTKKYRIVKLYIRKLINIQMVAFKRNDGTFILTCLLMERKFEVYRFSVMLWIRYVT